MRSGHDRRRVLDYRLHAQRRCAAYPSSGTTMDELFHAADLAMYQAKNAGRNVVRQALDRALFTGAPHAVGRAVSLHPDQAQ